MSEMSRLRPEVEHFREVLATYDDTKIRVDKELVYEYERLYKLLIRYFYLCNRAFDV